FDASELNAAKTAIEWERAQHQRLSGVVAWCDEHISAFARCQHEVVLFDRVFEQAAIYADEGETLRLAEHEIEIAALGRVDDAPALQRAVAKLQRGVDTAIDQHNVALASEEGAEAATAIGRIERAGLVIDADVAQHEHQLISSCNRIVWIFDEQRA